MKFWANRRQLFHNRIGEELPVSRNLAHGRSVREVFEHPL